ncbi:hypothetical protein Vadar_008349 [Vaccinium darrowii]|uniref:Uncharacterized protein n=1 Tax=Vaccinium darrowii TaxID=229202 RepID=A0ACB7ZAC7_9ERIC|nr:hypothetical protein Vadar_008349 [Vaccinium darrowii]
MINEGSHHLRNSLIISDPSCESEVLKEQSVTLKINPVGNEWLHRSAVAVMHNAVSMQSLKVSFKLETGFEAQFRSLGGRSVLITFQSPKDRDSLIKVLWMKRWFEDIKPWSDEAASLERFVWLSCQGMPLNTWTTKTFKQIGELWGYFILMEEETMREVSFDRGRILIATKENSKIEKWIKIDVGGILYDVKVTEESSFSNPDMIGAIVSLEKDAQDDSISKEKILSKPSNLSEPSDDEDGEDDVDALAAMKLQENSNDQVSLGGFESIVEESPNLACEGLEIPKMDEEKEGEIPMNDNSFGVPDSFGGNTDDTISNCDSLVGDSSEDINSFEDIAAARQLENTLEAIPLLLLGWV